MFNLIFPWKHLILLVKLNPPQKHLFVPEKLLILPLRYLIFSKNNLILPQHHIIPVFQFQNSLKSWGIPTVGQNGKFCWGIFFFFFFLLSGGNLQSSEFTIPTFSRLEKTIRKYWTSIKLKINMTCEHKEYEVKIKMVQEQWLQLTIMSSLGYNMNIVI